MCVQISRYEVRELEFCLWGSEPVSSAGKGAHTSLQIQNSGGHIIVQNRR